MKRNKMPLPMLKKCCGCLPLKNGCRALCVFSTLLCMANIAVGSWNLRWQRVREPEDNLISMSMVMFSTLSAISNIAVLCGMCIHRPGYIKLAQLSNSVFILCIFLVAVVTCLFSPELASFFDNNPLNIALVVVMILVAAAYSIYYLIVVNSYYRRMKLDYSESAIPV